MKKWIIVVSMALAVALLFSCTASRKATPSPASPSPSAAGYDESFDPVSLNDDDITFPAEPSMEAGGQPSGTTQPAREKPNVLVNGFRVQLMATKDMQTAELIKREAMEKFAPDSINVYVEFDSPYYKIRICDCKSRDEAVRVRDLARTMGYKQAWIVRTRVWSNPPLQMAPSPAQSENP